METDIRYYRRRACEELSAASRAVTPAARERRLQLVDIYLDHLKAMNAPSPFDEQQLAELRRPGRAEMMAHSAFCWAGASARSGRA